MAQSNRNRSNRIAKVKEAEESSESMLGSYCEATDEMIREYPMATTLAVFGIGLAIGTAIASMLSEPSPTYRTRRTAETLGRRVLDSLTDLMPETVRHHLHA